jgi:hypothetical protein
MTDKDDSTATTTQGGVRVGHFLATFLFLQQQEVDCSNFALPPT